MRGSWRDWIGLLVLAILLFFTFQLIFANYSVVGVSMEPVVGEGHRILVNKTAYLFDTRDGGIS
jgi:signal peptidase I